MSKTPAPDPARLKGIHNEKISARIDHDGDLEFETPHETFYIEKDSVPALHALLSQHSPAAPSLLTEQQLETWLREAFEAERCMISRADGMRLKDVVAGSLPWVAHFLAEQIAGPTSPAPAQEGKE